MLDEPTWKEVYAPRGYLAVEGEWIKRTAYGKTLEKVAKHGADAFYHGEVAEHMIRKLDSLGGVMTLKDVRLMVWGSVLTGVAQRLQGDRVPANPPSLEQENSLYHLGSIVRCDVTRHSQYSRGVRLHFDPEIRGRM